MTVIGPSTGSYDPSVSVFSYSDCATVSVDTDKARFTRPLSYGTLNYVNPHARVRFRSDAPSLTIKLKYTNLHSGTYYYDIVTVLVDGVVKGDYDPPDSRSDFPYEIPISFANSDMRTIEVLMPYCAAVDFVGVQQDPRYHLTICPPRPTTKMVVIGDSQTNGFYVTQSRNGWDYLLAQNLGLQCINMGFAGGKSNTLGDGSYMANFTNVKRVTVLLGVNDCVDAVPLNTFQSNMQALYTGILANLAGDAKLFAITPLWSSLPGGFNLADYRTRVSNAAVAVGDPRVTVVDGLALCNNDTSALPDGNHPGDFGAAQIAASLTPIMA